MSSETALQLIYDFFTDQNFNAKTYEEEWHVRGFCSLGVLSQHFMEKALNNFACPKNSHSVP